MEVNEGKVSRREALRRMAKASVGLGMGLQLVGAFVPAVQAGTPAVQGGRFSTIGHVSSQVNGVLGVNPGVDKSGTYTNGATYNNGNTTYYDNYTQYSD